LYPYNSNQQLYEGRTTVANPVREKVDTSFIGLSLDLDFNFISVNEAYAQAHGEAEDFFPGKNHFDLYPSDAQQVLEKVRESKKSSRITAHPFVPPGKMERNTTFWDWTVDPILNQENEVEALILAETEVTKRVRTEQALYKSSKILAAINHAQDLHNPHTEPREILDTLLAEVIDLTESEYGFIGEVLHNADGQSYMEVQTILNFTRNNETQAFSVAPEPVYLDLSNPDTLLGEMISRGEAVISNDPANDPRSSGLPEGHPALNAFLGIPFNAGEKLAGAVGVANCADGYDKSLAEFLQPLLKCYLQLIHSNAADDERREALTSLEESEYLIRDLAIPAVENEHSELIDLINQCYDEMDANVDAATIKQLLDKIYSAVAEHFMHEEQLMWSTAYPEYEAHKKNHDGLLVTLRDNIDRFVEDPDHDVHILQRTLANWFGRHFSTFDLRLNNHFSV
jgi:hemerythrin-like metal-binding protein